MTHSRAVSFLLILSAVALALMVPGGFVENRSFPGYSIAVLAGFNIFLTLLGLGSLVLAYRILRTGKTGVLPICAGLGFVLVYLSDLAHIFPISTMPMSFALTLLECIGTVLGAALALVGFLSLRQSDVSRQQDIQLPRWFLILMALSAGAIVVFATVSAI